MAKTKSKRKTRSDKFRLTLHKTGRFCKKIRGKLYYFGTNKQEALQRYLEQAVDFIVTHFLSTTANHKIIHRPILDSLVTCPTQKFELV